MIENIFIIFEILYKNNSDSILYGQYNTTWQ